MFLKNTLKLVLYSFLVFVVGVCFAPTPVSALSESCSAGAGFGAELPIYSSGASHTVKATFNNLNPADEYQVVIKCNEIGCLSSGETYTDYFGVISSSSGNKSGPYSVTVNPSGSVNFEWNITGESFLKPDLRDSGKTTTYAVSLFKKKSFLGVDVAAENDKVCYPIGTYTATSAEATVACGADASYTIWQEDIRNPGNLCYYPGCVRSGSPIYIELTGLKLANGPFNGQVTMAIGQDGLFDLARDKYPWVNGGKTDVVAFTPNEADTYTIAFKKKNTIDDFFPNCNTTIKVEETCGTVCGAKQSFTPNAARPITPFKLCDQITDTTLKQKCMDCAGEDDQDAAGVWTAVGCIKREPTALISSLIQIGLSVAGGVTLLVILSAGFMLTTSQGDPKKAGEAKDMITAAVIGILFIIFSVTILQFIGYNILKIPGFGG